MHTDKLKLISNKIWLNLKEAAILTGLSVSTLRIRIYSSELKSKQTISRGKILIRRDWLDKWLDD